MKKVYLPIFWKIVFPIALIVIVFGTINTALIWKSMQTSLENEFGKRENVLARMLASQSRILVESNNKTALQELMTSVARMDSGIRYVMVTDGRGNVLAHHFQSDVPLDFQNETLFDTQEAVADSLIERTSPLDPRLHDIVLPLGPGRDQGAVRIGIEELGTRQEARKTVWVLIVTGTLFFGFLFIGIFVYVRVVTDPIKSISSIADQLDIDALKMRSGYRVNINHKIFRGIRKNILFVDELDSLTSRFNMMIERLEQAYKRLETTHYQLIQSEKLATMGTLAAGLAHEINNPIAGLQNCIRRIKADPDNMSQNQKYLDMMTEAANRVEKVMSGMLEYARDEELVFQAVPIAVIIEKALLLVEHGLEKHNIDVFNELPDDMDPVSGSPVHLEQVFINLLINSIDAIESRIQKEPDAERRIKISAERQPDHQVIFIHDTGVAIPDNSQEKIFNPFFTTKTTGHGTGLGLSICRDIILKHHGSIQVQSQEHIGTTFRIELPDK